MLGIHYLPLPALYLRTFPGGTPWTMLYCKEREKESLRVMKKGIRRKAVQGGKLKRRRRPVRGDRD